MFPLYADTSHLSDAGCEKTPLRKASPSATVNPRSPGPWIPGLREKRKNLSLLPQTARRRSKSSRTLRHPSRSRSLQGRAVGEGEEVKGILYPAREEAGTGSGYGQGLSRSP